MIAVFTRMNGALMRYHFDGSDHIAAIAAVRRELAGQPHGIVLALLERNSTPLPADNTSTDR